MSAPFSVGMFVTNLCNQACRHCCTFGDLKQDELSYEEILDLIGQLNKMKVFEVSVSGGEPLFRKDIFKILKKLNEYPFKLRLCTNCTLIDQNVIKELRSLSHIMIRTSLDGSGPDAHDGLRGKGSFKRTLKGIELLAQSGFEVEGRCALNSYNYHDLFDTAHLAKELGMSKMEFTILRQAGNAKKFDHQIKAGVRQIKGLKDKAKRLIDEFGSFVDGSFIKLFKDINTWSSQETRNGMHTGNFRVCDAGTRTLSIRPDGEVIPCGALWDLTAGNIREQTLSDIWFNSNVLKQMRRMDETSLDSIAECSNCRYKNYCHGGCRASAFYYSKDLYGFCGDCSFFCHDKDKTKSL